MSEPGVGWDEARRSKDVLEWREHIRGIWGPLGADELRVVWSVVDALVAGREQYGELDILGDERDFDDEGDQERTDMLVYRAIAALRRNE